MIEPELAEKLQTLEQKIDAAYQSAEKTRKYILWTAIISAAVFIIPLLILPFAAMSLLNTYTTALNF